MRRVVVDMQNTLFADAIAAALKSFDPDFDVLQSESPDKTIDLCEYSNANILLMEVTAYEPWNLDARMNIRNAIKIAHPECRIALVVDEKAEKKLADRIRLAKKDGLIDSFIYSSVSSTYLAAVIDTL